LRSATNVYYPHTANAVYLPRGDASAPSELVELLRSPRMSPTIDALQRAGVQPLPEHLRPSFRELLEPFSDDQIRAALHVLSVTVHKAVDLQPDRGTFRLRREEYDVLRTPRNEERLLVRAGEMHRYEPWFRRCIAQVMLVHKLRETRVLTGFSRVLPSSSLLSAEGRSLLRRTPNRSEEDWLPAYVVYGEGVFLEFNEALLAAWENTPAVARRVEMLERSFSRVSLSISGEQRAITARFVLLHTFAHLLVNELAFDCGYSSASLRERLYVSDSPDAPMAGVLIYTAAGDAEGTLGGLVRMGRPGLLEPSVRRALDRARWCASDPVCIEMGLQGPDSCNLAACHNCGLVPETACEEFNRFLDRGVVIGTFEDTGSGFLST